ncbi:hypothetical protein [Flammeovirga aprica]|uniref:Uncharacterized protein n=1 Tax=Flammeovirga aprica JL-4 TaxID=694437 RepID=A0A7X9RZL4_9BACT|nr:hypothetical protein [Flammeovirga aprica]NME71670.1 hypothetical protein [Flammeovirga aprica JL-4]
MNKLLCKLFIVFISISISSFGNTSTIRNGLSPISKGLNKMNFDGQIELSDFTTSRYIDTDGKTMVIGAYEHPTANGAAFVYELEGEEWILKAKLRSSENIAANNSHFGYAVAI